MAKCGTFSQAFHRVLQRSMENLEHHSVAMGRFGCVRLHPPWCSAVSQSTVPVTVFSKSPDVVDGLSFALRAALAPANSALVYVEQFRTPLEDVRPCQTSLDGVRLRQTPSAVHFRAGKPEAV